MPALIQGDDPEAGCQMRSDQIPRAGVVPGAVKEDHGPSVHRAPLEDSEPEVVEHEGLLPRGLIDGHRSHPFNQKFHNRDIGCGKIMGGKIGRRHPADLLVIMELKIPGEMDDPVGQQLDLPVGVTMTAAADKAAHDDVDA